MLWIDLHPEYSDQTVTRCKDFLTAYPKADRAGDVRKALWAVALHSADERRSDEAVALGQWLLDVTPDSALRQQIDQKVAAWQAGPAAGPNQPSAPAADAAAAAKQAEVEEKLLEHKRAAGTPFEVLEAIRDKKRFDHRSG